MKANQLTQSTLDEVARMIAGGMEQISPRELQQRLETCGYSINKGDCFCYVNSANAITYRAKSLGYLHAKSGMRYAHVDAPRDTLPALQEIRRNCFVFQNGRIWEL